MYTEQAPELGDDKRFWTYRRKEKYKDKDNYVFLLSLFANDHVSC